MIGVLGFHRSEPGDWSEADILVAEAVARELGVAMHAAQLLKENAERLEQQTALLKAAQVVTSELRLETVLQRLVVEVTKLLDADAADCYLYDADRSVLRCAAVYGLDPELVEFEFPAGARGGGPLRRAAPARRVRGLRERDLRADDLVRGATRAARRGVAGPRPGVRGARVEPPRDLRGAGLARRAQRRELRAERPAGTRPARLLRDRLGARRASLACGHARRGRARGERGTRADPSPRSSCPGRVDWSSPPPTGSRTSSPRRSPTACRGRRRRSRRPPVNAGCCPRPRSTTTSASARTGGASRGCARCWRSPSTRRAGKREVSSSSSSPSSGRSRTTTSSWAAGWPAPPEAGSSGASSTRASERRARSPSSSPAWAASSPPSSTLGRSSTRSRSRRRRCSAPTPARSRSSRETSSS